MLYRHTEEKFDIIKSEIEWLDGLCDSLYADYGFKAEELEYGPGLPVSYLVMWHMIIIMIC